MKPPMNSEKKRLEASFNASSLFYAKLVPTYQRTVSAYSFIVVRTCVNSDSEIIYGGIV